MNAAANLRGIWRLRRGFSLLELIMVGVIITLLAAMAAPRYASLVAHQHLDAAARRIQSDIELTRRTAKFSSSSRTISFSVATDSYSISGLEDPDRTGHAYSVALSEEPYQATIDSALFGSDANLVFDGYGVADSAGSVTVTVGEYQRTISVGTGTVTVGIISKKGVVSQ